MRCNKQRNNKNRLPPTRTGTNYKLLVIREVCDSEGQRLDVLHAPYDGSVKDAMQIAEHITDLMHSYHQYASDIQSRILATDEYGRGKWAISPNVRHIAEAGTPEAAYISGDLRFASQNNAK
jgi:hypothetical protein